MELCLFADDDGKGDLILDLLGIEIDAVVEPINGEFAGEVQAGVADLNRSGDGDFLGDSVQGQLARDLARLDLRRFEFGSGETTHFKKVRTLEVSGQHVEVGLERIRVDFERYRFQRLGCRIDLSRSREFRKTAFARIGFRADMRTNKLQFCVLRR